MAVEPDVRLPIEDETYDVVLCCAGFFDGLMSPRVFPELLRLLETIRLISRKIFRFLLFFWRCRLVGLI